MSRSRGWVFTWNNYGDDWRAVLDGVQCVYIVAGKEIAPTTDTAHLQGYVYFRHPQRAAGVRRSLPGSHVESAKGTPLQCDTYCRKEDPDPYARGIRPVGPEEKGEKEKRRWEEAWEFAKAGRIEEIPADIRVRQYGVLRRIERDYMPPVERLPGPCGLWIWGAAGSGKTRSVLDTYPDAYPKPRSQWWDGYQGQPIVYVDDIDIYDVKLGGSLKLWADAYPFIGEIKGGSQKIRPTRLIVTSQYRIEEIWTDRETREALLRRFVVVKKILGEEINLLN